MEIAAFVVSVIAVITAIGSALFAHGANKRADEANRIASDALELQAQADARVREFRDVRWAGRWTIGSRRNPGTPSFELTNLGKTTACGVILVLGLRGVGAEDHDEMSRLGEVGPGETVRVALRDTSLTDVLGRKALTSIVRDFSVHWSSELGSPGVHMAPHVNITCVKR